MPATVNNTVGAISVLSSLFVNGLFVSLYSTYLADNLGRRRRVNLLPNLDLEDDDDIGAVERQLLFKVRT